MTHIVFVNDSPLRLVDVYDIEQWKGNTSSIFVAENEMTVEQVILEMESKSGHPGFIYMAVKPDVAWQQFISYCTLIEASGGLVKNDNDEYLLILRHGKWDLPKGKVEYDESPVQAALREVKEECGLKQIEPINELPKTFHTYFQQEKRMLKKTHWYLMKSDDRKLTPQKDEDIQKAEWMNRNEIRDKVFRNTYTSIKEFLQNQI